MWFSAIGLGLWQWAEDDDPALIAAREAWDRVDSLLIGILLVVAAVTAGISAVLVLRERSASLRRRLSALGVVLGGCGLFALVVARMGVIWLFADPREAGGPSLGSGQYWYWCIWLFGATLIGIASVIGAFIVVGAEDL